MSVIHTTGVWGSWSGGQTVITEPAPGPQAVVTLVDPTDRQALADWTAAVARPAVTAASLRAAARRADYATPRPEDAGDAYSIDPLEL